MKPATIAALVTLGVAAIVLIAVIVSSITRVNDDEACQIFYQDGNRIITKETSGIVFLGPGAQKFCLSRATQHLIFEEEQTGLQSTIEARSVEGLTLTLELDIEFRYIPERIAETVLRVGYDRPEDRLLRTARAEVRNVASQFGVTEFLTGSRASIALAIQQRLQTVLREQDGVFVSIIQVNLLHIQVYTPFEQKFQEVEDRRLAQIVASENVTLIEIEENRELETASIAAEANRNKLLREAMSRTVTAELEQQRLMTEARTAAQQAQIQAESDRIGRLIRARTQLDETIARREFLVQQVHREASANQTLSETERQNVVVRAEGEVRRALANRTRDVQLALTNQTRAVEALVSSAINSTLQVFRTQLQSNFTAAATELRGRGRAADIRADTRAHAAEYIALQRSLNLTDRELASVLLYRGLQRRTDSGNLSVLFNYAKQPFNFLELGDRPVPVSTATTASTTPAQQQQQPQQQPAGN
ncbi:hypothetical protein PTSG_03560 [Salpingoeca rosetta]|uniref:Band 7 domain-containing protein n=1 Tax=Salpingoeca rosetta (strain ATCC 50818 / BSB-021) TaxID=946362 RepID=F2U5Y6_SALR5|nr:uncharacterized protein PTSG_03560 [Salpingoeca rosetta]EGD82927.1 hypothetical protein PTSG_03560 [Salpingoeca rosetta]|eukprot:XP_004995291.1 hypothetical protein PTSG_03560 [Salpingoeca rosetta]